MDVFEAFSLFFSFDILFFKVNPDGYLLSPPPPIVIEREKRKGKKSRISENENEEKNDVKQDKGVKEKEVSQNMKSEQTQKGSHIDKKEVNRNIKKEEKREGVDWSKGNWNERFQEIMGQVRMAFVSYFKTIFSIFLFSDLY